MEGWTGVMVIWWGEGGPNLKDVGAKVPSLGSIASQGQVSPSDGQGNVQANVAVRAITMTLAVSVL